MREIMHLQICFSANIIKNTKGGKVIHSFFRRVANFKITYTKSFEHATIDEAKTAKVTIRDESILNPADKHV